MRRIALILSLALSSLLPARTAGADADADDDLPPPAAAGATPALSAAQQQAVGLRLARPQHATAPPELRAYGLVLDGAALVAALGQLDSSRAAAQAARLEAQRLEALYHDDNNASLRAVQAARAAQLEAQAQAQAGAALFAQQWGPLAKAPEAARQKLLTRLAAGQSLLLRADLPGQSSLGVLPGSAFAEVDGIKVPARVLGPLPHAAELQSTGLLLQLDQVPPGLGPGARLPVELEGAGGAGLLLPRGALLYGEQGAYVYRVHAGAPAVGGQQYDAVKVQLLQQLGDAWLVRGVDDDDLVVVQGAGVLWSLQGLGGFSAAEEDHD